MINDLSFLLRLLALVLIGPGLGGMGVAYQLQICRLSVPQPQFVLVLCLVLPVFLLTALLHELGHAVAARWANLRVTQIALFGLSLYQADSPNPWRLRVVPGGPLGSSVVAIARDGTALRRRHVIYILGGAMMGFFVAALCLGAGQALFSHHDGMFRFHSEVRNHVAINRPNTPVIATLNLLALANLSLALWCLVPMRYGPPHSDGAIVLDLIRLPHVERDLALSGLHGGLLLGVRPRDWEPGLVARLHDPGLPASESLGELFLYYYHVDRDEATDAERHLLRAISLLGESRPVPSGMAVEAAYVAGLHHRDGAKAREWLTQVKPEEVEPHTRQRAEAAALLAEAQFGQAIAVAEQGLGSSWKSVDPGGAKSERDLLQQIIAASRLAMEAKG